MRSFGFGKHGTGRYTNATHIAVLDTIGCNRAIDRLGEAEDAVK